MATRLGLDSAPLERPGSEDPTAEPADQGIGDVDPDYRIDGLDELPGLVG